MDLSLERENFLKIATIILDVVPKYLRTFFIKKWDEKYPEEKWKSDEASGKILHERLGNAFKRNRNNHIYIEQMKTGEEMNWDTLTLVKALLNPKLALIQACREEQKRTCPLRQSEKIDRIREIRNGFVAHRPTMCYSSDKLHTVVTEIKSAAEDLFEEGFSSEIDRVQNSTINKISIENLTKLLKQETTEDVTRVIEQLNGKSS